MRHHRSLALALGLWVLAGTILANTYTVTSTADSGAGTLRQAILDANANPGADTIAFNITGTGPHTIAPTSSLPEITDPVTIDGYTQPGASPNTMPVGEGLDTVIQIEIDGTAAPGNGLLISAPNVTVRGLAISRFSVFQIETSSIVSTSNLVVEGCFIGISPDGLQSYPGGNGNGVEATNIDARIGGLTPAARNLIAPEGAQYLVLLSGQGVVQGNLIGTDRTGTRRAAGRTTSGLGIYDYSALPSTIGGSDPNAANVIGGVDTGIKVEFHGGAGTIQGNFVGVDAGQTGIIPGGTAGISTVSQHASIGGSGAGEGNVIGGFDRGIIANTAFATILGNAIGTDRTGTANFGNRIDGIDGGGFSTIGGIGAGEANLIAYNGWAGVFNGGGTRLVIRGNRFFANGVGGTSGGGVQGIAIDLGNSALKGPTPNDAGDGDTGANNFQNYPIITSAVPEGGGTRVIGTLNSTASTLFDLDFYGNPGCLARPRLLAQADAYLGSTQVTTDGSGNASFNVLLSEPIEAGAIVTATATDPDGNTSELSPGLLFRDSPGLGGPGNPVDQTLEGQAFEPGATITVGGNPVSGVVEVSTTRRTFTGPSLTPGGVYDIVLTNPSGSSGTIHNGYVSRFADVAPFSLFDSAIGHLAASAITAGCGGGSYCPNSTVTRKQMAVFIMKARHGICYTPPACTGVFADVPCSSNFAPWIEAFAAEGITGGCGGGNYCPDANVRRDQMAVFILKGKHGSGFTPPPCAGTFPDVACPSTFADWIEQLAAEGVTSGCGGGDYCPLSNVTRGQMAAFLTIAFNLP